MNVKAKWFLHKYYLAIVAAIFFTSVFIALILYINNTDWKITLTVFGGLISFVYFIQKQQLDEAKFVNELFIKFNQRYDELNEELNIISENKSKRDFSISEKNILSDYFNLCAEEYLFYQKGYIYPEVWAAWVAGMQIYYKHAGICEFWKTELKSKSYYDLDVKKEIGNL